MKNDANTVALDALKDTVQGMNRIGLISDEEMKGYSRFYNEAAPSKIVTASTTSPVYAQPVAAYVSGGKH